MPEDAHPGRRDQLAALITNNNANHGCVQDADTQSQMSIKVTCGLHGLSSGFEMLHRFEQRQYKAIVAFASREFQLGPLAGTLAECCRIDRICQKLVPVQAECMKDRKTPTRTIVICDDRNLVCGETSQHRELWQPRMRPRKEKHVRR